MKHKYYSFLLFFLFITFFLSAQTGNVKLGDGSGVSITTGDYNIMVGDSAAFKLTSGSLGVFLGRRAGYNNRTASENIFIGADAGYTNTTGTDNVFIGTLAGFLNRDSDNVFIGTKAGYNNTFGSDNVFIGEESGFNNTFGDANTFIGEDAGYNNTTASDNTFIGRTAGRSNTTGFKNTAIGSEAGYDLYPDKASFGTPADVIAANYASYNTFVGDSTGVDVGRGAYNTFVGQAAGAATELGSRNTFVGFRAGWDNGRANTSTKGFDNTYFGYRTGHKNRDGNYNLLLGSRTDFINTGSTGNINNYNIALGYNSRIGAINNSILIGKETTITKNNTIAIGNNITADLSNTMILGGATNRVTVAVGTNAPNIKASLDLADTDKGFLVNRLDNTQRTTFTGTLVAADIGMLVYDTDDKILYSWNGTAWTSSSTGNLETRVAALEAKANGNSSDKTPLLFNYQTSLLNSSNTPLVNTTVSFRISILQTTNTGTSVYQETHSVTTNSNGLTSFKIGNGAVVSGDFSTINWGNDIYFLKVEADVAGGTTYTDFGVSQFVTVPYAMHARTADRLTAGTSAKTSNTKTAAKSQTTNNSEVETLKQEVKELKIIVAQLQNSLKNK